jgi:hypothetical protein
MVLQVVLFETDRHSPIQAHLDHHLAAALTRVDRLVQLVATILETHRVVVGHHALLLEAQDRRHVEARPQHPVRVAGLARRHAEQPVVLGQ